MKQKLKHPAHHDTTGAGDGERAEGDEFVFVASDMKEKDGASGGASITSEALGMCGMHAGQFTVKVITLLIHTA